MLAKLIQSLFPEGQRKVMVSLIVILVGTILEKFGGGLSENMMTLLIAGVGIFTTGNVIQGVTEAIKGTKVGQIIEDILPGDQGLGAKVQMAGRAEAAPQVDDQLAIAMNAVGQRFAGLEQKLAANAANQAKIVEFVNKLSRANAPKPAPAAPLPPRPAPIGPGNIEDDE